MTAFRRLLPLALAALLAACATAPAATPDPSDAPESPVGAAPDPREPIAAVEAAVRDDVIDAVPVAVDHFELSADGLTLRAYYYGGVDDCYGLGQAELEDQGDGTHLVRLAEGRLMELEPDTACIDIAVLKFVTFELRLPLVSDTIVTD